MGSIFEDVRVRVTVTDAGDQGSQRAPAPGARRGGSVPPAAVVLAGITAARAGMTVPTTDEITARIRQTREFPFNMSSIDEAQRALKLNYAWKDHRGRWQAAPPSVGEFFSPGGVPLPIPESQFLDLKSRFDRATSLQGGMRARETIQRVSAARSLGGIGAMSASTNQLIPVVNPSGYVPHIRSAPIVGMPGWTAGAMMGGRSAKSVGATPFTFKSVLSASKRAAGSLARFAPAFRPLTSSLGLLSRAGAGFLAIEFALDVIVGDKQRELAQVQFEMESLREQNERMIARMENKFENAFSLMREQISVLSARVQVPELEDRRKRFEGVLRFFDEMQGGLGHEGD